MAPSALKHGGVVVSLSFNVVSSVGVIIVNKRLVFMEAGFRFSMLLTIIHFIMTFAGCIFFVYIGKLKPKRTKLTRVFPLCAAFCGYVAFNNLSLLTNTVSVYQVSKLFCTPVIVCVQYACYGIRERRRTLLTLIPVCAGATLTVFTDAELTPTGLLWCVLAVASNSLYTIMGKTKQEELQLQPMQLLLYQAPLSAVMLLTTLPFDDLPALAAYTPTVTTVWTIALSCVLAFGVNFSFFLLSRDTSPLTVNVVGYFKTAAVFLLGILFVDRNAPAKTLAGIALTLFGLALYTREKIIAGREARSAADGGKGGSDEEAGAAAPTLVEVVAADSDEKHESR